MQYLIVGVDPGTTVGLAFVDLHGKPIKTYSAKHLSEGDVIAKICEVGSPIIIASDKNPLPGMVQKLTANFECRVFVPRKTIKIAEKNALTNAYTYEKTHERDALAAALKAYSTYSGKLRQLEARFGEGWETRIREVLLHETPLEEPRVIVQKEIKIVEKPPEKYAEKIRELEETLKRIKAGMSGQREIIHMQRKRVETLEHHKKTGHEKKLETQLHAKERTIQSLAHEKEKLEKSLGEALKAATENRVAVVNLNSDVFTDKPFKTEKIMFTESRQVFEWCKSNDQNCTLAREIYRAPPLVLVRVLGSCEPKGKGWIHSIVEEYRKERE